MLLYLILDALLMSMLILMLVQDLCSWMPVSDRVTGSSRWFQNKRFRLYFVCINMFSQMFNVKLQAEIDQDSN